MEGRVGGRRAYPLWTLLLLLLLLLELGSSLNDEAGVNWAEGGGDGDPCRRPEAACEAGRFFSRNESGTSHQNLVSAEQSPNDKSPPDSGKGEDPKESPYDHPDNPSSSPPPPASAPSPESPNDHPDKPPSSPPPPAPAKVPGPKTTAASSKKTHTTLIVVPAVVATLVLVAVVVFIIWYSKSKKSTVKPFEAALTGQLKKALVEGVQSLKESELRSVCEEFCNVIGEERSDCSSFKGMLSSGGEIAVNRFNMDANWTKSCQKQFKKRIATLSRVHHKNFVCLIGYCEEDKTPSRMMVFEYVSNGTLYEHLHVKEQQGDHLSWAARLRIAMGVAYCLEHMDQLDPPVILGNIDSGTILLTEDFAAKIADMELWSQTHELGSTTTPGSIYRQAPDRENVVYRFGIILLELVTGRRQYYAEAGDLAAWASKPLDRVLDPTLSSFSADTVRPLCQVIQSCLNPLPMERPSMKEVVTQLWNITSITPHAAAPAVSPLWWVELESPSSTKF